MSPRDRRTSLSMMKEFRQRFERSPGLSDADDALELDRCDSSTFHSLIDTVMLVGVYPWEGSATPRVLFQFPEGHGNEAIPPFCFPSGCRTWLQSFQDKNAIPAHIIDDSYIQNGKFIPLYFMEHRNAPYLFCFHFEVSPLTFPSFAHNLGLKELLGKLGETYTPLTTVCLAIKTKYPSASLFRQWIEWLLSCEMVARMRLEQVFVEYMSGNKAAAEGTGWPETERNLMMDVFKQMRNQPPPAPGKAFEIDCPPMPPFSWVMPIPDGPIHSPLAQECLSYLITRISMEQFITLFYSVLLERTVILYHTSETVIGYCVMCLHFLCHPLKWKSCSVSILPDQLEDLLDAPSPIFIGSRRPLTSGVPANCVYIDLVQGTLQTSDTLPVCPRGDALQKVLVKVWSMENPYMAILAAVNSVTKGMVDLIDLCTMTDYTNPDDVKSLFMQQLFIGRFPPEERPYLKVMLESQMFRYAVEQRCRIKSESMRIQQMKERSLESVARDSVLGEESDPEEKEMFPKMREK